MRSYHLKPDTLLIRHCATMSISTQLLLPIKGYRSEHYYSAAYMSQTQEQQRFTISKVAADWHELMILQRIMRPSIVHANGQLD